MARKACAFVMSAICMMAAQSAAASPFDIYGAGARGGAMAAQTATATDASAIYYNVGLLAEVEPGVTLGAFATHANAQILLMPRPDGYDIPDLGAETPSLPSNRTIHERQDTDELDPLIGLTFGGVTSLGIDKLRLGIIGFLPVDHLLMLKTHQPDERERLFSNQLYWELLDAPTRRFDIEAGIAYQITDWASVGVGGTFMTGADVVTNVYLPDPTDQSNIVITADVKTRNQWGLLAGLLLKLPYDFTVGLAYRGQVWFSIEGENRLQVQGTREDEEDRPRQELNWTPQYSPSMLSAGVSWRGGKYLLALDARYTVWSEYRDTQSLRPDFDDTLAAKLGVEYDYTEDDRIRMGLGWEPSPVPDQTGRTNYVDNSRAQISIGSAHEFEVANVPFEASWFLQFQMLVERETHKDVLDSYPACAEGVTQLCDEVPDDFENPETGVPYAEAEGLQTGNPGFPGFTSGGWIGALGLEVTF